MLPQEGQRILSSSRYRGCFCTSSSLQMYSLEFVLKRQDISVLCRGGKVSVFKYVILSFSTQIWWLFLFVPYKSLNQVYSTNKYLNFCEHLENSQGLLCSRKTGFKDFWCTNNSILFVNKKIKLNIMSKYIIIYNDKALYIKEEIFRYRWISEDFTTLIYFMVLKKQILAYQAFVRDWFLNLNQTKPLRLQLHSI